MQSEKPGTTPRTVARLTVWWRKGALTGSWHKWPFALFAQQHYEYQIGVPATLEYRK